MSADEIVRAIPDLRRLLLDVGIDPGLVEDMLAAASGQRREGPAPSDDEADPYALIPWDWPSLLRDGIPPIEYLDEPYCPRGARIWMWGPTGSAKSVFALWTATRLSHRGVRVSYFSEENPDREDLRRLGLLRPDPEFLRFFWRSGMDLTDPRWIRSLLATTAEDEAVFFDSWTDLWRGDENDNAAVRDFDLSVLKPLVAQGTTPLVVHHTGHPQMFSNRKGATAGRGASSLGQKADVTLEFRADADNAFTVVYGKPRIGGSQPDRTFRVVDTDDGGIDVVQVASQAERAVEDLAAKMAQAILTAPKGYLTTGEVRVAVGGSSATQREALALLNDDPRVQAGTEKVATRDGKQRSAKVWRPSPEGLV